MRMKVLLTIALRHDAILFMISRVVHRLGHSVRILTALLSTIINVVVDSDMNHVPLNTLTLILSISHFTYYDWRWLGLGIEYLNFFFNIGQANPHNVNLLAELGRNFPNWALASLA